MRLYGPASLSCALSPWAGAALWQRSGAWRQTSALPGCVSSLKAGTSVYEILTRRSHAHSYSSEVWGAPAMLAELSSRACCGYRASSHHRVATIRTFSSEPVSDISSSAEVHTSQLLRAALNAFINYSHSGQLCTQTRSCCVTVRPIHIGNTKLRPQVGTCGELTTVCSSLRKQMPSEGRSCQPKLR